MISGVQHYIGTICEIVDIEGSQFANYFYKELAAGKSIGESVKLARKNLINENPNDIGWGQLFALWKSNCMLF